MGGSGPKGFPSPHSGRPAAMDPAQMLRRALSVHQQGQLDEAERLYRSVLAVAPRNADALHFLGVLASQHGRKEEALELIGRAIELGPSNPAAIYNRANVYRDLKRFDE